jgi:hypothetical protein
MILGADVEERGDAELGWSRIISLREGKRQKSMAIKIPHHGSNGAHHDGIWTDLMNENPVSIVTPWRRGGRGLPTDDDRKRLAKLSGAAYLTSAQKLPVKKRYDRDTLKLIKHAGVTVNSVRHKCGSVRMRFSAAEPRDLKIELFNSAVQLAT